MRGIYLVAEYVAEKGRFNPARAGNIKSDGGTTFSIQVQPRPCGEYSLPKLSFNFLIGSTPPVRGI